MHSINNNAGHGSSEHDLHAEDLIIFKTDSSEAGVKLGKRVGSELQCSLPMHHKRMHGPVFFFIFYSFSKI